MPDKTTPYVEGNISAFGTKKKYEWYDKYKAGSNFEHSGALECAKSFNTFAQSRIKGVEDFSEIKVGGASISQTLKAAAPTDPGGLAKQKIAEILSSTELTTAQETFNTEIAGINQLLKTDKPEFHPGEIGSYLLTMKSNAKEVINAEHQKANEKLAALFEKPDPDCVAFRDQLKTALNCNDNDLVAVKDQMQAALAKTNKESLEKLEKAINDNANELFNASKLQLERLAFLADRYHRNETMRKQIEAQMRPGQEAASMEFDFDKGDATFKNVDIDKLTKFYTINSKGFIDKREITKNADGSFSIQLNRFFRTDEGVREDVASLVQALKAQGKEKITLSINNQDPKKAERDARLAFEGAIAAGVDPKNLTIQVNGDIKFQYDDKGNYDKKDLFKEHPKRLQFAMDKAARIAANTKNRIEGTGDSTRKIKERLEALKSASAPPPAPAPAPGGGGPI